MSDPISPVILGSPVTLTCIMEFDSEVVVSELSLINVMVQMLKDGIPISGLAHLVQNINEAVVTYSVLLNFSMGENNNGNYSCNATARPHNSSVYVKIRSAVSEELRVTTGDV